MRFIEELKKKREDRILLKAQKITEERLKQEQARKEEAERKEQEIQKLLNSNIPKEYILRLKHEIVGKNGNFMYYIYDYFLCETKPKDLRYGNWFKAIKISGIDFGKQFHLCVHSSPFSSSLTEVQLDGDCGYWDGYIDESLYIPSECATIGDLNNYGNKKNQECKKKHEEEALKKRQGEQQIQNQFFK